MHRLLVLLAVLSASASLAGPTSKPPSFCPKPKKEAAASSSQKEALALARKAQLHWSRELANDHRKGIDEWSPRQPAEAVANYGAMLATAGWRPPGLYMLASAAQRAPKSAAAWASLGAFMQQERALRDGAETVLRYALSRDATEPSANSNLADILYSRGDFVGAKRHWTVAEEWAPALDAPKLGLAAVAACTGDAKTAKAWLEKAQGGTPRWLKAWKSMVPDAPPPPSKTPQKSAETAKSAPKKDSGSTGPNKSGDLSVDGSDRPPMFDVDTGHGRRPPPMEGPPHSSELEQMLRLSPSLEKYRQVTDQLVQERYEASRRFEERHIRADLHAVQLDAVAAGSAHQRAPVPDEGSAADLAREGRAAPGGAERDQAAGLRGLSGAPSGVRKDHARGALDPVRQVGGP